MLLSPATGPLGGAEGRSQRLVQRGIHEVAAHMRIHSRRTIRLVTHIDLDEAAVNAIFGEVTDEGYLYSIFKSTWSEVVSVSELRERRG
jgi:hypothetical protein